MRIGSIELPEALLTAQRNGSLAIFAGSGVSMATPSILCDFKRLAEKIGAHSSLRCGEHERPDRFLGRLQKKLGTDVHREAGKILTPANSKPAPLHRALFRLFSNPSSVRLVTTNFDLHFTTASTSIWPNEPVETFYAPALPLGNEFNGIVYLHGSVREPSRMVLTDLDFGRAYLTQGWARRFLVGLFKSYTVLFVGYSHEDVVMDYLARGLPPSDRVKRFALIPETQNRAEWEFRGIEPIIYLCPPDDREHQNLITGVQTWADRSSRGFLEREQIIRDIVQRPPSPDPASADEIVDALSDQSTTRFFTKHADRVEWLEWVAEHGFLKPLFSSHDHLDAIQEKLTIWIAEKFMLQEHAKVLAIVEKHGGVLHPNVSWRLLLFMCNRQREPGVLAQWLAVFLTQPHSKNRNVDQLEHLLDTCQYPHESDCAIQLFAHLTAPELKLVGAWPFSFSDEDVQAIDFALAIPSVGHHLRSVWRTYFEPHLDEFAMVMEPIVIGHLARAHISMRMVGQGNESYDPMSGRCSAIEPTERNGFGRDVFDVVIDAARSIMEFLLTANPAVAQANIERYVLTRIPLLVRLAVHGVRKAQALTGDEKLQWLETHALLFSVAAEDEVFAVLGTAYANASPAQRSQTLDAIGSGPPKSLAAQLDATTVQRAIFERLVVAQKSAPDCELVAARIEALQAANPRLRVISPEGPVDLFDESGFTRSPISEGEMLAVSPAMLAKTLLGYRCTSDVETRARYVWEGLIAIVGRAVVKEPAWGLGLMQALADNSAWDVELWNRLLQGCGDATFTDDEWRRFLEFLDKFVSQILARDSLCEFLLDCVKRQENPIPNNLLKLADRVSRGAWEASLGEEWEETENWLDRAVNRPAGKLAQFWMHVLSQKRGAQEQRQTGIEDRKFFTAVIQSDTFSGALARTIFVGTLPFLMAIDAEFTRNELLPFLNWELNEEHALQAWQGLIYWARWLPVVEELRPLLRGTFARLDRFSENYRRALAGRVAHLALFGCEDPWTDGMLSNYIEHAGEKERCEFACVFGQQLEIMPPDQLKSIWERWLRSYIESRTRGIPLAISSGESQEMLNWALQLAPVFAEFASLFSKTKVEVEYSGPFIRGLAKSTLPKEAPEAVAELLLVVLQNEIVYDWDDVGRIVRTLLEFRAPREKLISICDQLARLGCPSARELHRLIG